MLAAGAILWSVFTLCTPLAARGPFFLATLCRLGLGAGEGVGIPATHALMGKWIPLRERSRAVAIISGFSHVGAILALLASAPIAASPRLGWALDLLSLWSPRPRLGPSLAMAGLEHSVSPHHDQQ